MTWIFLHIPKTAGTSMRELFERVYPDGGVMPLYEPVRDYRYEAHAGLRSRRAEELARARVIFGHASYGVHRVFGLPPRYLTFLRDPAARLLSFYAHQARDPKSLHHGAIQAGMSLGDMLRSERFPELNNHMVRILGACPHGDRMIDDASWLERARRHIRSDFGFVGVVEHMQASLEAMAQVLAWSRLPPIGRSNRDPHPRAAGTDPSLRDAIETYNRLDRRLYEELCASIEALD